MKTINFLFCILFASLLVSSCSRDYDAPPLNEPKYTGEPANITIKELKTLYTAITAETTIDTDYIIKGYITGNDISGNIYKQIIIQDNSGAISIGVDQSSLNSIYPIGQEVYVQLKGLSILKYGGELQIGYKGTSANRLPWSDFETKVLKNGWPDKSQVTPVVADMTNLTDDMVNTLVTFENVYFTKGGTGLFTDDSGNQILNNLAKTANVTVRSSSYSAQFATLALPKGTGAITGILGRYNNTWQLTLRTTDDIGTFDGLDPKPTDPTDDKDVVFFETFGDKTYLSGSRPKIADFVDADMKAPIVYSDASGFADIRTGSGISAHVWLPGNKESFLTIKGINTSGKSDLVLTYDLAANLYNAGESMDLNVLAVTCNGVALSVPSTPVSNANGDNSKFYTFTIENFPIASDVTLEFHAPATGNLGLRLDNIKIAKKDATIVVTP